MLTYLRDPANATTAIGIAISATALLALQAGKVEIAVALGLWSMLADQVDGIIATRTHHRRAHASSIGKCLDGLADMLYGATLPALTITTATHGWPQAQIVAVILVVAGALRLSFFSVFGLANGWFRGVPLSYDVLLLAVFLLARPWINLIAFPPLLTIAFAAMAVLHVAPVSVPAPRGGAYLLITLACIILSAALLVQSRLRG